MFSDVLGDQILAVVLLESNDRDCRRGMFASFILLVRGSIQPQNESESGVVTIATGAGIAFGQIMSGAVGPKYGWKVPFVVSAAPAVFFAFLTWMLVDEPVRGGMDVKVKGNHFGHLTEEEEELDKVATKEGKKKGIISDERKS